MRPLNIKKTISSFRIREGNYLNFKYVLVLVIRSKCTTELQKANLLKSKVVTQIHFLKNSKYNWNLAKRATVIWGSNSIILLTLRIIPKEPLFLYTAKAKGLVVHKDKCNLQMLLHLQDFCSPFCFSDVVLKKKLMKNISLRLQ